MFLHDFFKAKIGKTLQNTGHVVIEVDVGTHNLRHPILYGFVSIAMYHSFIYSLISQHHTDIIDWVSIDVT